MYAHSDGEVKIIGLDKHVSSTDHKLGLKLLTKTTHKFTVREKGTKELAEKYNWKYENEPINHIDYFEPFYIFQSRPIECKFNCLWNEDEKMKWEIADVVFEEGAFMAYEEYKTTLGLIRFSKKNPEFTIERKEFMDRYLDISKHKDIDYILYTKFSSNFIVKVEDGEAMDAFLTDEIKEFIEKSNIPHLESSGDSIVLFPTNYRTAQIHEYSKIIKFMKELRELIGGN